MSHHTNHSSKPKPTTAIKRFFITLLFYWLLCNWVIFYVLISGTKICEDGRTATTSTEAALSYLTWLPSVIIPLAAAFLSSFVIPPVQVAYKRYKERKKK